MPWPPPDTPSGFSNAADLIFDSWVVSAGPAEFVRDFDVVVALPATKPDGLGGYIEGEYRVRFTHCPTFRYESLLGAEVWRQSWRDLFTEWDAWRAANEPDGFVWAQGALAYPGPSIVEGSPVAAEWTTRLGYEMQEVKLETNAYTLWLVFHAVAVTKVSQGDPHTGRLTPL